MDLVPAPPTAYQPGRRRAPRTPRWRIVTLTVAAVALLVATGGHPASWLLGLPARAVGLTRADHAFLNTTDDTTPVTWNNCRAIHYVVNPQGAPADWRHLVESGLDEIDAASGYVFVYDGTTTDRAFAGGRWQGNAVLVMWGVRREYRGLGEWAAGWGGPITYDTPTGPEYGSGAIIFDSLYFDGLERDGHGGEARMIVEHEFMHVLGLDHVQDSHQVMSPAGREDGVDHLGAGDIAGLQALRAVPCPGAPPG